MAMLLVGDIGGTKTDLAVYSSESDERSPLAHKQFHSADYLSLQAIVREFLAETSLTITQAAFDVAGPVINRRVATTNLPWIMDEDSLARELNLESVHLMNDLEAVARAIPILREGDVITINTGEPVAKAAIGVIAPGTGLGQSFLEWDGSYYVPRGSEGGHADFAPTERRQIRLLEYLLSRFDHVSVERVCSGIGIPNIYQYLRDIENITENPEIGRQIASSADPTKAIVEAAISSQNQSPLCRATLEMFLSILGSEAGNLALKVLATGGIYLAGGVVQHTLTVLQEPIFMSAFTNKGRFSELMKSIPVHAIVTNVALMGAAHYGLGKLNRISGSNPEF
jgi:glucokinase